MSTPNKICKNDSTSSKSNNDNDVLGNMRFNGNNVENDISNTCANCGKEGSDVTNTCNKCKSVMYCNASCKKKHRHKHKKQCEEHLRLAAERAAELHDEKLFKPPPLEDCPICFQQMPSLFSGSTYMSCCGKNICNGCVHAPVYDHQGNVIAEEKCPFCRTPIASSEDELLKQIQKRIQEGDGDAMNDMGGYYKNGMFGLPQDNDKAIELWHRAADLGHAGAYFNVGCSYDGGLGVKQDEKKARHYWELAAIGGDVYARHNLGVIEFEGNKCKALKHYMIAVRGGAKNSLNNIKNMYLDGYAAKDDYAKALQAYQEYLDEIKSDQRDKAAAAEGKYKYY